MTSTTRASRVMAPADRSTVQPETARLIYEEITRRFDEENRWRDELESKAGTFLGFVGVFLSILLLYGGSTQAPSFPLWNALALPAGLQVGATLFLLAALYGHGQFAGPSPADVTALTEPDPSLLALQLADAYAFSMASNRASHAKAVASYHFAVLLAAAGLVQLAVAVAVPQSAFATTGGPRSPAWLLWLPGIGAVVALSFPICRGYAKDRRAAKELVYRLGRIAEARGNGKEGDG